MHTISNLKRLSSLGVDKTGKKLSLSQLVELDLLLQSPSRSFSSIHIAGTNGKGSVATKIAKALEHAGKKVGLYTSPHIQTVQERIVVNSAMVTQKRLERLLGQVFQAGEKIGIETSYFETLTLAAFLYFAEKEIDIAVVEVGLGGRLDATNILYPLLSVITSIDRDHIRELGEMLDQIAYEKAGIIKPSIPVIVGPRAQPHAIFKKIAKENRASCILMEEEFKDTEEENRAIARKALSCLPFPVSQSSIDAGAQITPSCRFEIFQKKIPVILDVGHNPAALRRLLSRVESTFPNKKIVILAAFSKDKEVDLCIDILKQNSFLYLSQAPYPRAFEVSSTSFQQNLDIGVTRKLPQIDDCKAGSIKSIQPTLQSSICGVLAQPNVKVLLKRCTSATHPNWCCEPELKRAFNAAYQKGMECDGVLLVCGTFYIMERILSFVKEEEKERDFD